jgi:site-specific recombinase XerD
MEAYNAALTGLELTPPVGAARTKPGTVNAAVVGYFNSLAFRSLASTTQQSYRSTLEAFRAQHGEKRIALLERRHLDKIIATKAANPAAANHLIKRLRTLMQFAIAEGMRSDDPTVGMKSIKHRSDGFLVWPEEYIARYRTHHALGSRARLALELLICTGQRRSDVIRMGRQHVRNGVLSIKQQKTGTLVEIPVLPALQAAIDTMGTVEHLTYLTTEQGKAFTSYAFGDWFRDRCTEAGIPAGYTAHGLRKAAATSHAEHGATAHELMSWFGWKTLAEAERYTRAANRKRLALGVAAKLTPSPAAGTGPEREQPVVKPPQEV